MKKLVILTVFWIMLVAVQSDALTISISPELIDPDTGTFDILIQEASDLGAFQFDLSYDPDVVTILEENFELGGFLGSTGRIVSEPYLNEVDEINGILTFGAFTRPSDLSGPNGDGVLATVTFSSEGQGASMLDFDLNNPDLLHVVTDTMGNDLSESVQWIGGKITDTCKVTAGENIEPSGETIAECGSDLEFIITPPDCHRISDVLLDGMSVLKDVRFSGDVGTYVLKNVTGDHTIQAESEKKTYTITTDEDKITVNCGADQSITLTPPDECHRIADVLVDGVSVGPLSTYRFKNVTADHTIRAEFERKTYTITTDEDIITVDCGADQEVTVTPFDCYHISDVLVDGVSVLKDVEFNGDVGTYTFKNVTANHIIAAVFERKTYNIIATSYGNCSIEPSGTILVDCGSDQAFTISCDETSVNIDILVDGVSVGAVSEYVFNDVREDHTIHATSSEETQMHSIAVSVQGEGVVRPEGDVIVAHGSDQTITMKPAECHEIGDVSADGESVTEYLMSDESTGKWSYTFQNVTEDHFMEVRFTPETFRVEILTDGDGTGSFSVADQEPSEVTCGDDLTITALPDECSVFGGWSENGNILESEADDLFLEDIRSGRTVTATFHLIPKGDVNQDGDVDIRDAILSLRIATGGDDSVAESAASCADVNEDARIGMEEVIYILRNLADTEML